MCSTRPMSSLCAGWASQVCQVFFMAITTPSPPAADVVGGGPVGVAPSAR
jgi:hypothetical protein